MNFKTSYFMQLSQIKLNLYLKIQNKGSSFHSCFECWTQSYPGHYGTWENSQWKGLCVRYKLKKACDCWHEWREGFATESCHKEHDHLGNRVRMLHTEDWWHCPLKIEQRFWMNRLSSTAILLFMFELFNKLDWIFVEWIIVSRIINRDVEHQYQKF